MNKISFAICAMLMLCDHVSASEGRFFENASKIRNHEETAYAHRFTTNTVEPIDIIQVPSHELLIFNGFWYTQHFHMNVKSLNGVQFHAPLKLDYDMTVQQLIDAIQTCIGPDFVVEYSNGWLN